MIKRITMVVLLSLFATSVFLVTVNTDVLTPYIHKFKMGYELLSNGKYTYVLDRFNKGVKYILGLDKRYVREDFVEMMNMTFEQNVSKYGSIVEGIYYEGGVFSVHEKSDIDFLYDEYENNDLIMNYKTRPHNKPIPKAGTKYWSISSKLNNIIVNMDGNIPKEDLIKIFNIKTIESELSEMDGMYHLTFKFKGYHVDIYSEDGKSVGKDTGIIISKDKPG